VAVAEELHFRRAAERLHVAQPAVSEQIRKLEEELGVRLLNRTPRSVSMTDAGAVLLEEARRVLQQADEAQHAVRAANGHAVSRLRIGYMPTSLPASIPRALQRLAAHTPSLEARLDPGGALELIEAVRSERLNAAIVSLPAPTNGLRTTPLGTQRAIVALPVGHEHATRPQLRLDQMAPQRIVVLPREADRPFYDVVVATCHQAELAPTHVEMPDASVERALLAVAAGAGLALLPESVADRYAIPGIRFLPLAGEQPVITTAVVTRRDTTQMATAAFLRAVSHPERTASATSLAAAA
jgi:DNA-binding transcriptional LysR family regulator